MKKISAGIIIKNEFDEFLLGHSTGNKFYDLFKGGTEPNETLSETALRECYEESGLILEAQKIKNLGLFNYNKEKDLQIFLYEVNKRDIHLDKLVCSTFVVQPTYSFPEIDRFEWFTITNLLSNTATSMNKIFKKIISENIIHIEHIPADFLNIPSVHEIAKLKKLSHGLK